MAKGIVFQTQSSNPIPSGSLGLWLNSAGNLMHTSDAGGTTINLSQMISQGSPSPSTYITLLNNTGLSIPAVVPVSVDASGNMERVDVSNEPSSMAYVGVTIASVGNGSIGTIYTAGIITNITTTMSFGDSVWVDTSGNLTNQKPTIGVNGFVALDFSLRVGVISKNQTNPSNKDLILTPQIMGQL